MKVIINAGGREVTIETLSDQNLTHADVADKALEVWKETVCAPGTEGPGYGFSMERRPDRDPSSTMRVHPGVPQ